MYNTRRIIKAITEQAGFRKSPGYEIAPSLIASDGAAIYNNIHPLITYKNITDAMELVDTSLYPIFDATAEYREDDVVNHEGALYQALGSVAPGAFNAGDWERTNQLSIELKSIVKSAASEVASAMMNSKKIAGKSKALWENLKLFEGPGQLVNTIPKQGRFVGFELDLKTIQDMALRLHSIGVQLSQPQASLNLYLYHTSKSTPLQVIPLTNVAGGSFSWHDLKISLPSAGDYQPGGSFIIGYRESELTGNAILKTNYEFGKTPCASCSQYNVTSHQKWSRFISINPFSIPETEITGTDLWDTTQNRYDYKTNFGLNLSLSVECDITETIVNAASVFVQAQLITVTHRILTMLFNNVQNSGGAERMRQLAGYELDNRENHTDGLTKRKEKIMQALDFDMSGLNSFCFPAQGIRVTKGAM